MSLCFPLNEYRRGLFCTPIPSLVRSFRSISDSLIQSIYLYIFDTVYHLIFHLNRFKLYFIIFLSNFWNHLISKLKNWRDRVTGEKRKKKGKKEIEIFDRGIRTSDFISVKGVLVLNRAWSHSSLKITTKKRFFVTDFKGMKETSLSMNE